MLKLSAMALLLCVVPAALASNTITGSVRNQSGNQPALGDDVILFRLRPKMLEEARAKTDAQGQFALNAQNPGEPYLVRVIHQNVNYDVAASVGDALSISVFDAAADVPGVKATVEMLRAGTQGKLLHVSDMYEVENASSPPMTQAGPHTFEVYLPPNARLDSVLAAGPEKMVTMISAAPVAGEPGHYRVDFPLRPGATKFAFNYDLPYSGYVAFQTRHAYPLQQLVVMVPSTMKFSSLSSRFQTLPSVDRNYQVLAVKQLEQGDGPRFELSGMGALPHLRDQANQQAPSPAAVVPDSRESTKNGAVPPTLAHTNAEAKADSTIESPLWVAMGAIIFLVCAAVARRVSKMRGARMRELSSPGAIPPTAALDGLDDDLFRLEVDRVRGSISEDEYATAREALEAAVKRSLV